MSTTTQRSNAEQTTVAQMSGGAATSGVRATTRIARWLALGAVIGPIVFTVTWIVPVTGVTPSVTWNENESVPVNPAFGT